MKAYTLSMLTKLAGQDAAHPVVERQIIAWANDKVRTLLNATHINAAVIIIIIIIIIYINLQRTHSHASSMNWRRELDINLTGRQCSVK